MYVMLAMQYFSSNVSLSVSIFLTINGEFDAVHQSQVINRTM